MPTIKKPNGPNNWGPDSGKMCDVTSPLAASPQPETPDYPSVFTDLPGRTATEDEFREHFRKLEPDDEP
jgi:hypothetical protein